MKKAVCLSVLLILAVGIQAQTSYKVIKVNGSIQYVRTGSQMALGDVFTEDEALTFGSPNARAAVINPEKGRFILTPQSASQLTGARSNFLPSMSNISTRGGFLNSMSDIVNQFSGPVAILYSASWPVNPYQFPMDEDRLFYLVLQYKGEKINKKLSHDENSLVFARSEILKVDGLPIETYDNPSASLYYYTPAGSMYLCSFDLVFPELKALGEETGVILQEISDEDYNRKVNELASYIFDFYGKPDKKDVMLFLERDFGLKK